MSASGKSSNRLAERSRGYHTGGGHGIYAAEGRRAREAHQRAGTQYGPSRPAAPAPEVAVAPEPELTFEEKLARDFSGQWVAVRGEHVIDADPKISALALRTAGRGDIRVARAPLAKA